MSDDFEMAQCFSDYLEHREASNILSKYQDGYEVILLKTRPTNVIITTGIVTYYRVLIIRLGDAGTVRTLYDVGLTGLTSDGRSNRCAWYVDGVGESFIEAVRWADQLVQQKIDDIAQGIVRFSATVTAPVPAQSIAVTVLIPGETGPQAGPIGIGAGEQG